MRTNLVFTLAVVLVAGCAQQPARQAEQQKSGPQSFIDRSAIFYPRSGDRFNLVSEYTYPNVGSGIQITYQATDLPDAKIDIFIYPIGDVHEDQALASDLNDVHTGVDAQEKNGTYKNVRYGTLTDFNIPRKDNASLPGKKLPLTFDFDGTPMVSAAYLSYKQLYLFELRITAPANSGQSLQDVGDRIARETFPKIHIMNEGTCALQGFPIGGTVDQLKVSMKSWVMHITAISCFTELTPDNLKPDANEGVQILKFQPQDWQ